MTNKRSINSELKLYIIDYDRVNELCVGEVLSSSYGGSHTKHVASRNIKNIVQRFNETIIYRAELSDEDRYHVETLKFNKILLNTRKEKIKKILEDDGD